jgi:carboxyl-terminal processing protease
LVKKAVNCILLVNSYINKPLFLGTMLDQIKQFMVRSKWITLSIAFVIGISCWAFNGKTNEKDLLAKQKQLLTTVGTMLQQKHYDPKQINDAFAKSVFKHYLAELDNDKSIFLQADINQLKKFETKLDDEILGKSDLQFFPAINALYLKRLNDITTIYRTILQKPFDFTTDENVILDPEKIEFAKNEAERKESWRKRLKFMTLERYSELLEQQKTTKDEKLKNSTPQQLEQEARQKVLSSLDRFYTRLKTKIDDNQRFSTYVNTIAETMDPHTNYFAPVDKRSFDEQMSNKFYGIGAQLSEEDGKIKIVSLVTGGPAWKSKAVEVNDVIVKVSQGNDPLAVDLGGYAVEDAVKLIRGAKDTDVKLTLKKADGTNKIVVLKREEIKQDEAAARSAVITQPDNKRIGYIYLPEFYADFEDMNGARSSVDVAGEVMKLKAENVDGIVIDLRNNGGGSLYEVVQMVGLFIEDGPVVQVKDKEGRPSVLRDNDKSVLYDGPLAVMMNEFSASASEIFAAAIQDYKRGVIIGSTSSYGKGTVQRNIAVGKPLDIFSGQSEFGALKITQQKFYRINGGSTQMKGVTPDIVLPDRYEYLKYREKDNEEALKWDEIQKSDYKPWKAPVNYQVIEKAASDRIANNNAFKTITSNSQWLDKNADRTYSLNFQKYLKEQAEIKKVISESDSILKLKEPLNVKTLELDKNKFQNNPDKAKGLRYQQWLESLKTDLYIKETATIVSDMIPAKNGVAQK